MFAFLENRFSVGLNCSAINENYGQKLYILGSNKYVII